MTDLGAMLSVRVSQKGGAPPSERSGRSRPVQKSSAEPARGRMNVMCISMVCGVNSGHDDPVKSSDLVKWGRGAKDRLQDGSVTTMSCDWYCERTYQGWYSHQLPRHQLIDKMKKDKHCADKFLERRSAFIHSKKLGEQKTRGSGAKHKISKVTDHTTRFVKPRQKFWPIDLYKNRFGDPKSKANRKRKHKVISAHGKKGVLVPGDDNEPWEVETSFADKRRWEMEVEDAGSDADSEQAEHKFKEMVELAEQEEAELAVGMSWQDMLGEEHSGGGGKGVGSADQQKVQPTEAPASPVPAKRNSRGSSSSIRGLRRVATSPSPPASASKRMRTPGSGKKSTSRAAPKRALAGSGGEVGTDSPPAGDNAAASGPGRPPKDIEKYTEDRLVSFKDADDSSIFFKEETSLTQLRALGRSIAACSQKLVDPKGKDQESRWLIVRKKLQIMEGAIKAIRAQSKPEEMLQQCRSLQHFMECEPHVDVAMPWFYTRAHLESMVACMFGQEGSPLVKSMASAAIGHHFATPEAVGSFQYGLVKQGITATLARPNTSTDAVVALLKRGLLSVFRACSGRMINSPLRKDQTVEIHLVKLCC